MPTCAQELDGAGPALGLAHVEMDLQRLGQLKADRVAGIEARHRLLEDHRHVIADDAAALAGGDGEEIDAVELQSVGGDLGGPRQEAHHRQHGNRLAGTQFTDDGQHFARLERQRNPVDGTKTAMARGEVDGEIFDGEKRHRGLFVHSWRHYIALEPLSFTAIPAA